MSFYQFEFLEVCPTLLQKIVIKFHGVSYKAHCLCGRGVLLSNRTQSARSFMVADSVGRPQTVGGIGMDGLGVWTEFMVNFKVSFFGR